MISLRETFSLIQNTSLASHLEREIEAMILAGELAVGDRIADLELAERFKVSRSPVREALRALDATGLVEVIPNRGAFVKRIAVEEAMEVYEVRAALFGQAGRLMAERAGDADCRLLGELHREMGEASASHAFDRYFPLNFRFHELIVDAAGNRTLAAQYRMLVKRLRLFRARNLMFRDTLEVSNREHEAIVDAIGRRDGEAAGAACFAHVEQGRLRVMERLRSEAAGTGEGGEERPRGQAV
ncbi:FCD domain-containing protein [Mangrovicella endophytica]|uniref:FCD domain-containing protein n=1 Tax=Mangrovicella endophytica TaxID=2066697 RepID=UPI000C9E51D3|nr:FCD domain-containing protein [Mangrovicella endophytica]